MITRHTTEDVCTVIYVDQLVHLRLSN